MTKHTSGKWEVQPTWAERGKFAGHRAVRTSGGGLIAYLPRGPHDDGNEANARLIAAAPETKEQRDELLAALRDIQEFCDDPDGSEKSESLAMGLSRLLPAARAAIAKAEGRS